MAEVTTRLGILRSGALPLSDDSISRKIDGMSVAVLTNAASERSLCDRFMDRYDAWIRSSRLNRISGLNNYDRYMTFAVTHAIEQFLMCNRNRRIRTFNGEYPGTAELIARYGLEHQDLSAGPILANDAVILSVPFSGSGNQHPMTKRVLHESESVRAPVMIDCAFLGICKGIDLDLNGRNQLIAFSLSKCYKIPFHRVGMIYSNAPPSGIKILHDAGYTSRFGAAIALGLFDEFGPDYLYEKFSVAQEKICDELGDMVPSDTVIFANGNQRWSMFDRGDHNRVHIGNLLPGSVG